MNKHRFLEDFAEWFYYKAGLSKYPYNEYGDDYTFSLGVAVCFLLILLLILYCLGYWIYTIIDKRTAILTEYTGTLIDKKYIGESNSSGTGTAVVSTGSGVGVGLVSTSSHSDEEFLFFIEADKVYKCNVDMQNYYHFKTGDSVRFSVLIGGRSGGTLETKLI